MNKRSRRPVGPIPPWAEILLAPHEFAAVKAMLSAHPLGCEVLLHKICRVDGMEFAEGGPEGDRATCFSSGKRWVGTTLRNIQRRQFPVNPRGPEPAMPSAEANKTAE